MSNEKLMQDRYGRTSKPSRGKVIALASVLFAAFIALSWQYNPLERLVPTWVARVIYPIDKTNIDILRFLHFLAIAWLVFRERVRPLFLAAVALAVGSASSPSNCQCG